MSVDADFKGVIKKTNFMYILLYSSCCLAHETFEILTAVIVTVTTLNRAANMEQTNNHRTHIYEVFIQPHVSTLWGHHKAHF